MAMVSVVLVHVAAYRWIWVSGQLAWSKGWPLMLLWSNEPGELSQCQFTATMTAL